LIEEIAHGGMGVVYKARQTSLNRIVAIKIIQVRDQSDSIYSERFELEAQAAAQLQHPNIVAVHEFGVCGDRQFISMDFVDGHNLHDLCEHHPLDAQRAARYVATIAEAIHYAHQLGVLHRDLKPSNVLIDQFDQPRITDFGLAKSLATDARLTLSGQTLGTPQYIPPEQASIHHGLTSQRSDVYSIGGILYHLLTGRPPFVATRVGDVLHQVMFSEPIPPRALNPGVPRDLETICLKCLEKDPLRRYATANALATDLSRFLQNKPILARPTGPVERCWRWCRRRPQVAALWLALALALLAGFGGVIWQWQRARAGELMARRNAYAGDMILVQQALEEGDLGQARLLLDRLRPELDQPDLRGWEWRYCWMQSQPDPAWRRSLFQHTSAINNVVSAPDGKWLALSAADGTVATVDLALGLPKVLQLSNGTAAVVAMSPRGQFLAFTQCTRWLTLPAFSAAEEQGQLRLWDVAAAKEVFAVDYEGHVLALAFTPDGRFLVTLTIDNTWANEVAVVWNIEEQTRVATHVVAATPSGTYEESMAVSPRGDTVAVGDATGQIHVLGLPELDPRLVFPAHDEMVTALAFSPNGLLLASGAGYSDPTVRLWNPSTGEAIATALVGHSRYVRALTFAPDGETLASASADQSVCLWRVPSGELISTLRGHEQEVRALGYLPDGSGLVSACKDGSIWLWDASIPAPSRPAVSTADGVWQFAFLADGRSGVVVTTDRSVELWDLRQLESTRSLPELGNNNWMVAPSSDGRFLAVADQEGRVKVWDLQLGRVVDQLTAAAEHTTTWAKFAAENRQLFTAGLDPECRVTRWDTATWKPTGRWQFGNTPYTGDVSISGQNVVAGLTNGLLAILNCDSSHQWLLDDGVGAITATAFSPDESILATGNDQCALRLWNARSWLPFEAPQRGHRMTIPSIAFSPDGQRIATAGSSGDEAIILWDVPTRRPVATLNGQGSRFIFASFSPDGSSIAAVARDSGRLHIWRAADWASIADHD